MKNEGRDELMKRRFYAQQEHKIEKFYILYILLYQKIMTLYTFSICLANDVSRKETYIARSEKALYQHLFYKLCNDYDWCNYIFIDEDIADKVYDREATNQVRYRHRADGKISS